MWNNQPSFLKLEILFSKNRLGWFNSLILVYFDFGYFQLRMIGIDCCFYIFMYLNPH